MILILFIEMGDIIVFDLVILLLSFVVFISRCSIDFIWIMWKLLTEMHAFISIYVVLIGVRFRFVILDQGFICDLLRFILLVFCCFSTVLLFIHLFV